MRSPQRRGASATCGMGMSPCAPSASVTHDARARPAGVRRRLNWFTATKNRCRGDVRRSVLQPTNTQQVGLDKGGHTSLDLGWLGMPIMKRQPIPTRPVGPASDQDKH